MSSRLQILVVDDTIVYRTILKNAVSGIPGAEVVGVAPNGEIALDKIRQLNPNLVLMDVEMPHMDGLEALSRIRELHPGLGVVMISGTNRSSVDSTIRALELGALDFVRKPDGDCPEENTEYIQRHLALIFAGYEPGLVRTPVTRRSGHVSGYRDKTSKVTSFEVPFGLVVIGCSTGGPTALMELLPCLPADFPTPILVVQHMPSGFTESLARSLDEKSPLNVREAVDGEVLTAGSIYMAPGGRHLMLSGKRTGPLVRFSARLNDGPPVNNCKPSVDVLLQSVRDEFKGRVLTVILTGMGSDGLNGVEALKEAGKCYCITQSQSSCVVYGMPRAVEDAGLSDSSLPLEVIGVKISRMIEEGRPVNAAV